MATLPGVIENIQATFSDTIADNAAENQSISFPDYWATAGVQKVRIHGVTGSFEAGDTASVMAFDILFWGTDGYNEATGAVEKLQGIVTFAAADIEKIGAEDVERFSKTFAEAPMFYEDQDLTSELHITLVNRAGGAFHADDTLTLTFQLEAIE